MSRRVVVTGMGAVSPVGNNVESLWDSIKNGRSGTGPVTRFDVEKYNSKVAAEVKEFNPEPIISAKEVEKTDLFCQYAIISAAEAVENAGLEAGSIDPNRVGVIIGSGIGGITTLEAQKENLMNKGPRRVSPHLIPMMIVNMASGLVSMRYGFHGPNTSVVTACATGNHSIGEAMRLIQNNEADVMVAGGTEAALTPLGFGGFCSMRALTGHNDEPETASRPFEKTRDGFIMGEGAGVVILEELEHAKKRGAAIYAELVGFGMSGDAHHITMPDPEGRGARLAMSLALEDAQVGLDDLDYINAHGTSTPYNDKFETVAIKSLFGERASKIPVSSTKSMTGHLLGAAGAVEFVICVRAVQESLIPPTINYREPDPECDLDYVPNEAREQAIQTVMSNSFGFGGHNAVLVLKKF
ncbi:MAG: beta-ketoacyl-ACP synthase II [Candidatus Omnitrophica bacterium]|nr:beta-ketoacyl-ACP synthase II [Candidatus Omnitrophota bacterium]